MYRITLRYNEYFQKLIEKLKKGKNILIIEVDGPDQLLLPYYKQKYGVGDDFIKNGITEATDKNLNIFLNDPMRPFGHGFTIAMILKEELARLNLIAKDQSKTEKLKVQKDLTSYLTTKKRKTERKF